MSGHKKRKDNNLIRNDAQSAASDTGTTKKDRKKKTMTLEEHKARMAKKEQERKQAVLDRKAAAVNKSNNNANSKRVVERIRELKSTKVRTLKRLIRDAVQNDSYTENHVIGLEAEFKGWFTKSRFYNNEPWVNTVGKMSDKRFREVVLELDNEIKRSSMALKQKFERNLATALANYDENDPKTKKLKLGYHAGVRENDEHNKAQKEKSGATNPFAGGKLTNKRQREINQPTEDQKLDLQLGKGYYIGDTMNVAEYYAGQINTQSLNSTIVEVFLNLDSIKKLEHDFAATIVPIENWWDHKTYDKKFDENSSMLISPVSGHLDQMQLKLSNKYGLEDNLLITNKLEDWILKGDSSFEADVIDLRGSASTSNNASNQVNASNNTNQSNTPNTGTGQTNNTNTNSTNSNRSITATPFSNQNNTVDPGDLPGRILGGLANLDESLITENRDSFNREVDTLISMTARAIIQQPDRYREMMRIAKDELYRIVSFYLPQGIDPSF
ncbi:MAG: hypothetical protein AAF551_00575 [Bacteroidota bacterium]